MRMIIANKGELDLILRRFGRSLRDFNAIEWRCAVNLVVFLFCKQDIASEVYSSWGAVGIGTEQVFDNQHKKCEDV